MADLDPDLMVTRSTDVLAADMDDQLVMLDPVGGEYYALQDSGKRIWEMLAQPIRVGEICERMRALHPDEAAPIEADVIAFLADLRGQGLIRQA